MIQACNNKEELVEPNFKNLIHTVSNNKSFQSATELSLKMPPPNEILDSLTSSYVLSSQNQIETLYNFVYLDIPELNFLNANQQRKVIYQATSLYVTRNKEKISVGCLALCIALYHWDRNINRYFDCLNGCPKNPGRNGGFGGGGADGRW